MTVTPAHRSEVLQAAAGAIDREPGGFRMNRMFGPRLPGQNHQGCVASYIVQSSERGRLVYDGTEPGELHGREVRSSVSLAATALLGLEEVPAVFSPEWPPRWFDEQGPSPRMPAAAEAAEILRKVADSHLPEALEPRWILRECGW